MRRAAKERGEGRLPLPSGSNEIWDSIRHVHLWRLWKCGVITCIYSRSFCFEHTAFPGLSGSEGTITSHLNVSTRIMSELLWTRSLLLCLSTSAAVWPCFSLLCFPNGLHMGHTHNVCSMNQPFHLMFSACASHAWHFLHRLLSADLTLILYSPVPEDHNTRKKLFTLNCLQTQS